MNELNNNSMTVTYPSIYVGTNETQIFFTNSTPNLTEIYKPGKNNFQRRCFVTDATVATLPCMVDFIKNFTDGKCKNDELIILGSGEAYKNIESVLTIVKTAVDAGFARKDLFVGIGGGVICDLTGFAASLFKRSAHVEFVPTTLLAMVDASIGGKTGCDFDNYKNMIGSFFPAQKIYMFPEFLKSLSKEQFRSGLAEAFKTSLLYDKNLFQIFKTEKQKILERDPEILTKIIQASANAKGNVVERDFTEKNERMFLNFGHTFGHALETIVGLGNIAHGDAVAWGIGRALDLSAKFDFCLESYKDEVLNILNDYGWETKPVHSLILGGGTGERLLLAMHKDKKNSHEKIKLVLQKGLCDTFTKEFTDEEILSVLTVK